MEQNVQRAMLHSLAQAMGIDVSNQNVVGDVVRMGDKVILPEGANIPEVIEVLKKRHRSESQTIEIHGNADVPPWDGSIALTDAMNEVLGMTLATGTPGFFGEHPPEEMEIEVELGKTQTVRWGRFLLPGMGEDAFVQCGQGMRDGLMIFEVTISCERRHEARARKIIARMREIAAVKSLHKGKAFSLRFRDDEGNVLYLPTPRFFPISTEKPIFRRDLEDSIERNIFTVLRHRDAMVAMGEPLKRGVLFAGEYGTGKTMLASYIADEAVAAQWTFIYVKEPEELPMALGYAQRYQPCVVFCEDVDRVGGENRTSKVNNLLNQLDGIDSKSAQLFTILTTNHADSINMAMRRPGRIDLVLHVLPPDAEAVGRMIHHFAKGDMAKGSDLTEATRTLDGFSPAFVHEAVKRAKLEALRRTGKAFSLLTGADVAKTALEVSAEKAFFTPKSPTVLDPHDRLAQAFAASANVLANGTANAKAPLAKRV